MNHCFHFLVIEESFAARIVIRTQLMKLNQHVDMTSTLEDALDKMVSIPYDIILVDINSYKKINDLDLTLLIKEQQPNGTIPIILITGEQALDLSHHNKSIKNPLYFKKPFTQNGAIKIIDYLKTTLKIKGSE